MQTQWLKRWPALYALVTRLYFTLHPARLQEMVLGTKAREKEWAGRHRRQGNDWGNTQHRGEDDEWVLGYWESQNHPHRAFLMEKIASYYPFRSILEVGCNCGPNLKLMAGRFPDTQIAGIDINPKSIEKGRELFALEGISNVSLSVGQADRLERFPDKSFDITFTDAVLIYIGPDKIQQVVREMLRVTRRTLLLLERHSFKPQGKDPRGKGVSYHGLWIRDYAALLGQFLPEKSIKVTPIPEEAWPDEGWKEYGAVIEASL